MSASFSIKICALFVRQKQRTYCASDISCRVDVSCHHYNHPYDLVELEPWCCRRPTASAILKRLSGIPLKSWRTKLAHSLLPLGGPFATKDIIESDADTTPLDSSLVIPVDPPFYISAYCFNQITKCNPCTRITSAPKHQLVILQGDQSNWPTLVACSPELVSGEAEEILGGCPGSAGHCGWCLMSTGVLNVKQARLIASFDLSNYWHEQTHSCLE